MDSRLYWIWLAEALGAGSKSAGWLLDMFSTALAVYQASPTQLREAGATPRLLQKLADHSLENARGILNRLLEMGGWLLTPEDALYPMGLHRLDDRPIALYCKGTLPSLDTYPAIALVGTRRSTREGRQEAYALGAGLAAGGLIVVSGGAKGIDAAAHAGALAAGGRCVLVMGCALDGNYPTETAAIRQQIVDSGGVLISEYAPGFSGKCVYQVRNRLMVGLSLGVCLGETPQRSGARISARLARENGRDVFALPGAVSGHHNDGAHLEIRSGAMLVTRAADIIEEYSALYPGMLDAEAASICQKQMEKKMPQPVEKEQPFRQHRTYKKTAKKQPDPMAKETKTEPTATALPEEASLAARQVHAALTDTPQPVDLLAQVTGLSVPALLAALTELEMFGCAANSAGQQYYRV